jgi:serpin B
MRQNTVEHIVSVSRRGVVRRYFVVFAAAAVLSVVMGNAVSPLMAQQEKADESVKSVAKSVNDFSLDLYGKLRAKEEGNIFFSPSSISTALSMTYAGARGKTAGEMKKTLCYTLDDAEHHKAMGGLARNLSKDKQGCKVSIANALWGQKGYEFLAEFLDKCRKNYDSGLNEVDFKNATEEARQTINAWVEDKTNDKIKDLIKPGLLNPMTRLVLTNAIHFKGTWKKQFKEADTKKEKFHLTAAKSEDADMMYQKEQMLNYHRGDGFQAVELPYSGEDVSMVIFLPDKVDGLADFEKKLTGDNYGKWIAKLYKHKVDILAIPRFKMTCEFGLGETLKEMGIPTAFGPAADFSGMTGDRDLFISEVVHKAFVDVNEEGTEAAAATAVVMEGKSARPRRTIFRADHPFLFVIRDTKTGTIMFMGRVLSPGA